VHPYSSASCIKYPSNISCYLFIFPGDPGVPGVYSLIYYRINISKFLDKNYDYKYAIIL